MLAVLLAATLSAAETQAIRQVAEPFLPGMTSFECPGPAKTSVAFHCDGTLEDGGKLKVVAMLAADGVFEVGPIFYDATPRNAFVEAVREYANPSSPIDTVRCTLLGATPDSFDCTALLADGTSRTVIVSKQPDGTLRVTAVRIESARAPGARPILGAVALLGLVALIFALVQIFRVRARSVVTTLPLIAEQTIRFPAPGDYILNADAPRFSMAFGSLQYSLVHLATGTEVKSFPALLRAHSSGITRVRMALRRFFVESEGEHVLRIQGLGSRDTSDAAIVFSKAWHPLQFLWVVLAAGGGLVMFLATLLFMIG